MGRGAASHNVGERVIVKVQRPIATTRRGPIHLMIYGRKRHHTTEDRADEEVLKTLTKQQGMGAFKNYFYARWNSATQKWELEAKAVAPWQDW